MADARRRRAAGARIVVFVALAAMLVVGGVALAGEATVRAAWRAGERPPAMAGAALAEPWAQPAGGLPPRAAMLRALVAARAAFVEPDRARRTRLIASARRDLAVAEAARPGWGEADVVRTYVELVGDGAAAPATRAAFARSYRAAPFLEESSLWRVRYGGDQWDALDSATRDRVIDEAMWYRYRSRADDGVLLRALAGGEAERRYRAAIRAATRPGGDARPPRS